MATQNHALPWVPAHGESLGTLVLPWSSAFHNHAAYRGEALYHGDVTCKANFYVEGTFVSNESIYDTVVTNRIQSAGEQGIKIYDGDEDWMWFHANRTVSIGSQAPEHLHATLFVDGSIHATELHTDYIIADRPVQVPNGILTDTIAAGIVTCKQTMSKRVLTTHTFANHVLVQETLAEEADASHVDHVTPLHQALQKVQALQGVTFEKPHSPNPQRQHLGLLAQDVEPHVPEVVFTDEDPTGPRYVAYANLVPLLIESIKELKTQVDEQATTIQSLQAALHSS